MARYSESSELAADHRQFQTNVQILINTRVASRIFRNDRNVLAQFPVASRLSDNCLRWLRSFPASMETIDRASIPHPLRRIRLVGMGGASQSAKAYAVFADRADTPELEVFDSIVPEFLEPRFSDAESSNDLNIVASKSGETIETLDVAETLLGHAQKSSGNPYFLVVSDPFESSLTQWAKQNGLQIVHSDPDVPGRYTALSVLGLLPAKLLGLDMKKISQACEEFIEQMKDEQSLTAIWVRDIAAALAAASLIRCSAMRLISCKKFLPVLKWIEQLVAESLGKSGYGVLPVMDVRDDAATGSDNLLRIQFTVPEQESSIVFDGAGANHETSSVFRFDTELDDLQSLVRLFFGLESAVFLAGCLLDINPLDQPDVELSKRFTRQFLYESKESDAQPDLVPEANIGDGMRCDRVIAPILASCHPPGDATQIHIAILAYLDPTDDAYEALENLAQKIQLATMQSAVFNFGPQYLHSTGQFHKGGSGFGVYVIVRARSAVEVNAVNRPYSFGQLLEHQAAGDAAALKSSGNEVFRLCVSEHVIEDLNAMADEFAAIAEKNRR